MSDTSPLPRDPFSLKLRECVDHPGAIKAQTTVETRDFYGNTESWIVQTFRIDGATDLVFLQRSSADGGSRLVLPAEVTSAMARHRDINGARARRRSAATAMATKKLRGQPLGNPAALAKARAKRGKK